jgi:hypothetical protein
MKFLIRRFKENPMTFIKALAAASLVLASAQAMAFTPPYHINGTPIIGAATFKSSGACKVASKKFANAQYGAVYDSTNASVGTGVIDASGNKLLAVINSTVPAYYSMVFQDATPGKEKIQQRYMISFVGNATVQYIASESGCSPLLAWANPASYFDIKQDAATAKVSYALKQSFVGLSDLSPLCVAKGAKQTCKGNKFSGGFTFTAQVLIP